MKKRNGIKKRLLSLMLTAAMMAGGVPNPANLVLADKLNNKITIEANTETEASAETEAVAESEIQSETEAVSQEETVTEDVSETDAVEGTTKETTEEETIEESDNVSETEIHTETETHTVEETVEASTEETENGWDGVTTENIYEAENYKITYTLSSHWNTGYNANVKIENTSDTAIENWYLSFDYNSEISNIWNAQIYEKTQNGYIIKNAGWNQDIPAGGFVEFGISGNEGFKGFPKSYKIQGSSSEVKTEDYTAAYKLQSDWVSGFVATVSVTNNTGKTLEDWVLEFDFDRQISQIWDGEILSHEGKHYIIKNAGYNANIAAGATVNFGFQGGAAAQMQEPENYKLYSYNADVNNTGETDRGKDTDNDKVADYIEEAFGTDKGKADTDGDGLSDYDEILSLVLDPCLPDTDGDGIADGDEDTDSDGLINLEEIKQGTLLSDDDTDNDGLNDGEEVYKYNTNPCCDDTDGDGALDGKEIELGTNPLVADKTFNISMESDDDDTVKASVSIGLSGEQIDTLSVKKFENDFLFPENMPGYIGSAYDFSVEGDFESAIINFEFDETLLQTPDFDPVIYYFNEEEQELEELETTVTGNVASARVEHFSKYILLNRIVFSRSLIWMDTWYAGAGDSQDSYTGTEVVFVIDDSGSMGSNDKTNQRLTVAQDLIDNLPQNSKVGIVKFASSVTKLTQKLTDDKKQAKSYLTSSYFRKAGITYMYNGISNGFSLFESTDDSILKVMVVLSDGIADDTGMHSSVITTANDNNVKIYTVGLGITTSYFDSYLRPLAEETAGTFYLASDAEQLAGIYENISDKIDINTDSDNDGLPDYYEDNLQMFNGTTIKLDKNNPDSDDDGLFDGEEVELSYKYSDVVVVYK